jgi:hypothetical protein
MLPPKSAFTTPVLSTSAPHPESTSRRMSGGGGPVIEYVRGPMRIAMAPVASANPNDAGATRPRRSKKLRRWERGGFRSDGPRSDGPRPDRLDARGGGAVVRSDGPPRQPPWAQGEGNGAPGERRRRRRRRKRRPGDGVAIQGGEFQPANNGGPGGDAPVSFFAPAGGAPSSVALGPDGQPLRKRRRRRRRGRGGRQREWRTQGQGGEGGNGGGGGGPPPTEGGGGGGVGSISDGGGGSG